jgi:hypothetical protein
MRSYRGNSPRGLRFRGAFWWAAVVTLVCSHCPYAWASPDQSACNFQGVHDERGLTVPGLDGATAPEEKGVVQAHRYVINGVPTGVDIVEMKFGTVLDRVNMYQCSSKDPGMLDVHRTYAHIYRLWRVQKNGNVFAYAVWFAPTSPPETDGTYHEIAAMYGLVFYDVDGDGKFTVMKEIAGAGALRPQIPDWVR